MSQPDAKIVQYLNEAHAMEAGLVRVLQSQVAMTPKGSYRLALERHLGQTRDHERRVRERIRAIDGTPNPLALGLGIAETVVAQAVAAAKTPIDLVRGTSGEEKVLKNAKDACATEALEIATYTALAELASALGDVETIELAVSIREEEQAMLDTVCDHLPGLTRAAVAAEVDGEPSIDLNDTGVADAVETAARDIRKETDIAGTEARRSNEPWPGYDEQNARSVETAVRAGDDALARAVTSYERSHKARKGVLGAASRETATV